MFIWSVRASTIKFVAVLSLGVILVAALVIFLPADEVRLPAGAELRYDNVESAEDMVEFLRQFGVDADVELLSDKEVILPEHFDGVFAEYNELQKKQGLDLAPYAGKKLRRVVLRVTLPQKSGRYLATLYIYRGCVVGGDVSSSDPTGATYRLDEFS